MNNYYINIINNNDCTYIPETSYTTCTTSYASDLIELYEEYKQLLEEKIKFEIILLIDILLFNLIYKFNYYMIRAPDIY